MHSLIDAAPLAPATVPESATLDASTELVRQPRDSGHDHDILTTAEGSRRLGVFVDFMRAADLTSLLLEAGPFTVFAPTDRAFLKLSVRERDALLADRPRLSRIMRGHVFTGRIRPPTAGTVAQCTTIDGATIAMTVRDGVQLVERARIVQANIEASNGVIHAIDSLLF